jgi:hypothetical protein
MALPVHASHLTISPLGLSPDASLPPHAQVATNEEGLEF